MALQALTIHTYYYYISTTVSPSRQYLWQLNLRCLQFKGSYWCRHFPGRLFTKVFGKRIDAEIDTITPIATCVDMNRPASLSRFTEERIRLPLNLKGLGIRDLVTRGPSEYISGVVQGGIWSSPPLLLYFLIGVIRRTFDSRKSHVG